MCNGKINSKSSWKQFNQKKRWKNTHTDLNKMVYYLSI